MNKAKNTENALRKILHFGVITARHLVLTPYPNVFYSLISTLLFLQHFHFIRMPHIVEIPANPLPLASVLTY